MAGAGKTISKLGSFFTKYVHKYYINNQGKVWDLLQDISYKIFCSNIGKQWGTYFVKKVPNLEKFWLTPATSRAPTVKGAYEVSYSWYGQIIGGVCVYLWEIIM